MADAWGARLSASVRRTLSSFREGPVWCKWCCLRVTCCSTSCACSHNMVFNVPTQAYNMHRHTIKHRPSHRCCLHGGDWISMHRPWVGCTRGDTHGGHTCDGGHRDCDGYWVTRTTGCALISSMTYQMTWQGPSWEWPLLDVVEHVVWCPAEQHHHHHHVPCVGRRCHTIHIGMPLHMAHPPGSIHNTFSGNASCGSGIPFWFGARLASWGQMQWDCEPGFESWPVGSHAHAQVHCCS